MIGVVEAVDHRQPVALPVGQTGPDQPAGGDPVCRRLAVFDDIAGDRGVFHHVGKIDLVHRGHAAARMALTQVTLQQVELLHRRPRTAQRHHQIGIARQGLALGRRGLEFLRHHPHRNAGRAFEARRAIGHGLAAAKTDPPQRIVERIGMGAAQLGEHLALAAARQIGTRRRAGDKEPGKANWCRHGLADSSASSARDSARARDYARCSPPAKVF